MTLLSIQDLRVAFRMGKVNGVVQRAEAVKGVSFDIEENTTVALVGESGSGKSVTAMSILNLLPDNAERSGKILWGGKDLLHTPLSQLQHLRGEEKVLLRFQRPRGDDFARTLQPLRRTCILVGRVRVLGFFARGSLEQFRQLLRARRLRARGPPS